MAVHQFDLDTQIELLGEGRYGTEISERWWVGRGPNGGYVAALIMRAIEAAVGPQRPPRSLTVHYQRAPKAGPAELTVTVEREGGRATFVGREAPEQFAWGFLLMRMSLLNVRFWHLADMPSPAINVRYQG